MKLLVEDASVRAGFGFTALATACATAGRTSSLKVDRRRPRWPASATGEEHHREDALRDAAHLVGDRVQHEEQEPDHRHLLRHAGRDRVDGERHDDEHYDVEEEREPEAR